MKRHERGYLSGEIRIRRLRDILTLLPLLAALNFGLPVLIAFGSEPVFGGTPLNFLAIFGAWLGLIIVIWLTNNQLRRALEKRR